MSLDNMSKTSGLSSQQEDLRILNLKYTIDVFLRKITGNYKGLLES